MSETAAASLRWVRYEAVFYPAVVVPAAEAPVAVPDGHSFVYFLGADSGAVVPLADVEPYDPRDEARASHPAAAAGVRAARELIAASTDALLDDDDEGEEDKDKEAPQQQMQGEEEGEVGVAGLASRQKEEKRKVKKEKERTAKSKSARYERAEDEAENDLLLPRTKRNREVRSSVEHSSSSSGSSSSTSSVASGSLSSDEQASSEYEAEQYENDVAEGNFNGAEEEDHWQTMAKDIGAAGGSRRYGRANGRDSDVKHRNSFGDDNDAVAMNFAYPDSAAGPFLAEIRHYYHKALSEATAEEKLVNMQEADLVRAVDAQLLVWRGELIFLEQALQDRMLDDKPMDDDTAATIRDRIHSIRAEFTVERIVHSLLRVVPRPAWHNSSARHGHLRRTYTSTDASLTHLQDPRITAAMPREKTHQLAQRYIEQRGRRDRILAAQQGLGKTGFTASHGHVMEKWRQSRELLVLDHLRETQPVSRRYSQTIAKTERHALKCINAQSSNTGATLSKLLSSYHSQTLPTFYNFHSLRDDSGVSGERGQAYQASSSHAFLSGGLLTRDEPNDEEEEEDKEGNENGVEKENGHHVVGKKGRGNSNGADDTFTAPLVSPLRTSFDPRAAFVVNTGDIQHENTLAEQLAMKSMQYSHSLCLPSQETVWENSEAYDASALHSVTASRRHGTNRASSVSRRGASRASSRASSMGRDEKKTESHRRGKNDWRASAKRAILEQLTLFLRGMKGKPAVINKPQFQSIGKKLLERAVRSESERSGISMSLQANNASTPFTKDMEARLRKSVNNYIHRYFLSARTPGRDSVKEYDGWQSSRSRRDEEDDLRSVMGDRHDAEDSPVYQP